MTPSATLVKAAEETAARTVSRDPANRAESPDYECESYRAQIVDVKRVRAVYGGSKTMRDAGRDFLPQHPMETDAKYKERLKIARAFNALRKTVEGLSGMIFRRDPSVSEDMPELLQDHLENIDRRGNKLAVFLHKLADDAILDGHAWVHVEAPPTSQFRNAQEAENAGVRPYWIRVKKSQAINWRYEIRDGRPTLTLFVYREGVVQPDGEFGEAKRERIRVLREGLLDLATGTRGNVQGELWELREVERANEKKPEWVRIEQYEVGIEEIPVVWVASEECGEFESRPPLLDLAEEQIEHYRVRSDRQKSLTFSSIAVPYCFGQQVTDDNGKSKVTWGADGMLLLNDPQAKAGMLESQGFGLGATKEELAAIKENMATLGLRMLVRPTSGVQPATATEEILGKSESNASLAAFAITLEDATNRLLEIHAAYETSIDAPGTVTINRAFFKQLLSPDQIRTYGDQVAAARLSLDTMWQIMVEGESLPEDFDAGRERARIRSDGAAGLVDLFDMGGGEGGGGGGGDGARDDDQERTRGDDERAGAE